LDEATSDALLQKIDPSKETPFINARPPESLQNNWITLGSLNKLAIHAPTPHIPFKNPNEQVSQQ
jgi:hypothetical protein